MHKDTQLQIVSSRLCCPVSQVRQTLKYICGPCPLRLSAKKLRLLGPLHLLLNFAFKSVEGFVLRGVLKWACRALYFLHLGQFYLTVIPIYLFCAIDRPPSSNRALPTCLPLAYSERSSFIPCCSYSCYVSSFADFFPLSGH